MVFRLFMEVVTGLKARLKKLYAFSLKVSEAIWWYLQTAQRGKKDHLHIYFLTYFTQEY